MEYISLLETGIEKAMHHLREAYAGFQTGRASTVMVENILVESYGQTMAMKAVATLSAPDAHTLKVEPWDRSQLGAVESALRLADLGINPQNMGSYILLPIPPMTEERRKHLVKLVHTEAENARISIRTVRQDALKVLKRQLDDKTITEDEKSRADKQIQELVDKANEEVQTLMKKKEQDVMTV
ncbi:ribosome recycling factor [Candidatus Peribacteria bacterium]|nr:ribosome recycling factor [Candidatus Peribacteria bacterium]